MFKLLKLKWKKWIAVSALIVLALGCSLFFIINNSMQGKKAKVQAPVAAKPAPQPEKTDNSQTSQTIKEYDDVRGFKSIEMDEKSIDKIDLSDKDKLIQTLTFNSFTKWPEASKLPKGFNPQDLMNTTMNPGLGIREIHKSGLTGKNVNVAIIDQPTYTNHPEFKDKIVMYKDFDCGSASSMHGPAVASLLVGNNIGTAPDAKLYYAAVPSWKADAEYYSKALNWIIDENRKLPKDKKIKVVSVSAAPSGLGSPFTKNNEMWDNSVAEAEKDGILILDCTQNHGLISSCWYDINDIENVSKCTPGFPGKPLLNTNPNKILVPASPRTVAEEYVDGDFCYQYTGRGGLSWAIPYCSGVLALGWQARPDISSKDMVNILLNSSYLKDGSKIINPKEFVKQVKEFKAKQ